VLFPYVITTIKDNNNIEYFIFDDNTCGEIYLGYCKLKLYENYKYINYIYLIK